MKLITSILTIFLLFSFVHTAYAQMSGDCTSPSGTGVWVCDVTDITATSARMRAIGNVEFGTSIEYRVSGVGSFMTSTGSTGSTTIGGVVYNTYSTYAILQPNTTYEFRAHGYKGGSGEHIYTSPVRFTTLSSTTTTTQPSSTQTALCGIGAETIGDFTSKLIGCGTSLVGGIALLFIIYGGFLFLTSAGDPNRVRIGKEYITYAIVGLVFALMTFFITQVVGLDILHIPGFSQ